RPGSATSVRSCLITAVLITAVLPPRAGARQFPATTGPLDRGQHGRRRHGTIPSMGFVIRLAISAVALWIATLLFSENVISSVFGREARIELTDDSIGAQIATLVLVSLI